MCAQTAANDGSEPLIFIPRVAHGATRGSSGAVLSVTD